MLNVEFRILLFVHTDTPASAVDAEYDDFVYFAEANQVECSGTQTKTHTKKLTKKLTHTLSL